MFETLPTLKRGPLIQQCEEALTQLVLGDTLKPGDVLPPEQELCRSLGVGRSTLREAVSVLCAKGLVERRQGVGVAVVDLTGTAATSMLQLLLRRRRAPAGDLLEVRRLYEVQAAAWAAERATPEETAAIGEALDAMRAARDDVDAFAAGDLRFHLAVAEAGHNGVLAVMVETIRALLFDAILENLKVDYRPDDTLAYHEAVWRAVVARDPAAAADAMARHLDDTEARLRRTGHTGEQ